MCKEMNPKTISKLKVILLCIWYIVYMIYVIYLWIQSAFDWVSQYKTKVILGSKWEVRAKPGKREIRGTKLR